MIDSFSSFASCFLVGCTYSIKSYLCKGVIAVEKREGEVDCETFEFVNVNDIKIIVINDRW